MVSLFKNHNFFYNHLCDITYSSGIIASVFSDISIPCRYREIKSDEEMLTHKASKVLREMALGISDLYKRKVPNSNKNKMGNHENKITVY